MHRHWDLFIKPALECIELSHIVEIGAFAGVNTEKILAFCRQNKARLTTIDTVPRKEVLSLLDEYQECFTLFDKPSLDVLSELTGYEAIIIDGDHNWYTVYHELKIIEKLFSAADKFPLVFFHDTAWPYGRRDMYYAPEAIPAAFRHEYSQKGMVPGRADLTSEHGWVNENYFNANSEGGEQNGVLTAIEDFIKESAFSFRLAVFNGHNGFGLLATQDTLKRYSKLSQHLDKIDWVGPIGIYMESTQFERICERVVYEQHNNTLRMLNSALGENYRTLNKQHNELCERFNDLCTRFNELYALFNELNAR